MAHRSSIQAIVAVPAYHEQDRIGSVVRSSLCFCSEVWVIDDGSMDATGSEAQKAGARVIRHGRNLGKGVAIRTALQAFAGSKANFLVLMDADGQHDPSCIPLFLRCVSTTGADIVVGDRMMVPAGMPLIRQWTNHFMSLVVSNLAGQIIPDSQCGFRLLSHRFACQFRPTTSRFDLESEMLIQAGRLGFAIESVRIPSIYSGQSSHIHPVWDTLRFARLILKYIR